VGARRDETDVPMSLPARLVVLADDQ
jgi:hypothetical protein